MMTFKDLTELGLPIGPRRKVMSIINEGPGAARKMEDATKDGYELDTEIVGVDHYTVCNASKSYATSLRLCLLFNAGKQKHEHRVCLDRSAGKEQSV